MTASPHLQVDLRSHRSFLRGGVSPRKTSSCSPVTTDTKSVRRPQSGRRPAQSHTSCVHPPPKHHQPSHNLGNLPPPRPRSYYPYQAVNSKKPHPRKDGASVLCRRSPNLPHTYACSTIGPTRLNFRVRDGNGCDPRSKLTGKLSNSRSRDLSQLNRLGLDVCYLALHFSKRYNYKACVECIQNSGC